jgi:hypothetical protein
MTTSPGTRDMLVAQRLAAPPVRLRRPAPAQDDEVSRRPWRTSGSVDLGVAAYPDTVYDVLSDVTRIGERSPEFHRSGWAARWSRRCGVVAAERGRSFAFRTLPERLDVSRRDSTTWRYDLEPVDGGTRVTHSYEITALPVQPIRAVYGVLMPHHRDMRPHMRANLEALAGGFAG